METMTMDHTTFKGIQAVTMENDSIRTVILPSYGGKMVSFFDKEAEYEWLFQTDREELEIPPYGADFSAFDSSGFDEMFPGIDQGPHPNDWKEIPDHGEVWALPWDYEFDGELLILSVNSPVFPYRLTKWMQLKEGELKISYQAENKGDKDFPFIWTPHALLNYNGETRIQLPEGMDEVMNVEAGTEHLGDWGDTHNYPLTLSNKTGQQVDLSKLEPNEDGSVEKFYFTTSMTEGWCSVVQSDIQRTLTYEFPKDKVPYLGIWKTEGGYRGEYNFALEPCTGVYDDVYLAEKIGRSSSIPAQGVYQWSLKMKVGGETCPI
ncbi:DUF5107 domain-containing protein [Halobacillus yeomjeoni]|uniref:aldose epimerase family protein n=1 Tax=Halobacillus yeomjeoni TaxID=311194 RepID=UPI001CD2D4EF|nr:DUF5107 domain-containing protein [Halobacillus yeomjeoni]MCA0985263.1 DUF5107 domain-containing protein [Halobacillus yeomjeoni]